LPHRCTNIAPSLKIEILDPEILTELIAFKMPYGKYKGVIIADLPVFYLEWFATQGFPKGKLGMLLATMYEIKINGLDYLLKPLRQQGK